jgi:hypothetical protein
MYETTSYEVFYRKNLDDLKKMFIWKTKVKDPDLVEELISKFILHMIENKILEKFNKKLSRYSTYVTTCLLRFAQKEANKGKSLKRGSQVIKIEYDEALHSEEFDPSEAMDLKTDWEWFYNKFMSNPSVPKLRKEVLKKITENKTRKLIAEELKVTHQAISLHIKDIKRSWEKYYYSN